MISKIDHIGIAVKSLKHSEEIFKALLGTGSFKTELVATESVDTSFFQVGESKVELLQATSENSPIAKFIEKKGEGIHHIAFEVDDIREYVSQLKEKGFHFINEEPKRGADNKLVCFIHPRSGNGVLIELCQTIKE